MNIEDLQSIVRESQEKIGVLQCKTNDLSCHCSHLQSKTDDLQMNMYVNRDCGETVAEGVQRVHEEVERLARKLETLAQATWNLFNELNKKLYKYGDSLQNLQD